MQRLSTLCSGNDGSGASGPLTGNRRQAAPKDNGASAWVTTLWMAWMLCGFVPESGAQVLWTFETPDQEAPPGTTLGYSARIQNQGPMAVFLNTSATVNYGDWKHLTIDETPLYTNVPWPLGAGTEWTGRVLDITVAFGASEGFYLGGLELYGGADRTVTDFIGSPRFSVTVTAVPEPAVATMLVLGAAILTKRLLKRPDGQRSR